MPVLTDKRLKDVYDTWWQVKIAAGKFAVIVRLPTENMTGAGETYITFGPTARLFATLVTPHMTLLPNPWAKHMVQFGPPMLRPLSRALKAKGYRLIVIDEPIWKG